MSADTLDDAGAATIEVRIFRDDQLLVRELCESEEEVTAIVERWSDVGNVYVLVDDLSARHGPEDILAPDELPISGEDVDSIASARIPGHGTE